MLKQRGLNPDRVESPDAAWKVFCDFIAVDVEGLETGPDGQADGFGVSWGCYSWNDGLPTLSFGRHFVVDVSDTATGEDSCQPMYWRVSLEMIFPDAPDLAEIDRLNTQDSGVYYERPGPEMDNALCEALWEVERYPALRALWASTPMRSAVDLDRSD